MLLGRGATLQPTILTVHNLHNLDSTGCMQNTRAQDSGSSLALGGQYWLLRYRKTRTFSLLHPPLPPSPLSRGKLAAALHPPLSWGEPKHVLVVEWSSMMVFSIVHRRSQFTRCRWVPRILCEHTVKRRTTAQREVYAFFRAVSASKSA